MKVNQIRMGRTTMTKEPIRTVDELEDLRVTLSQEIEVLLQTGKDRRTLDRVKALRQQLGEAKDELAIAKNIEANRVKESLLSEIRARESEANEAYGKMLSLAQEALPVLRQVEPLISQMAPCNERLEVRQPMVGIAWMVDASDIHGYIARLEGMLAEAKNRGFVVQKEATVSTREG